MINSCIKQLCVILLTVVLEVENEHEKQFCVFLLTAVEADPDERQLCVFLLTAVEVDPDERQLCVFPLTAVEVDPDERQLCVFPLTAVEVDPDEKQLCETVACVFLLAAGMAAVLEVEDEPEEKDAFNSLHEHARLEELARRNSLYLPHLRSAYPLEVFSTSEDVVGGHAKDSSRSSIAGTQSSSRPSAVQGRTKDFSRSASVVESSGSGVPGGHARDSGVLEGHFKDISRSSVIEGDSKDDSRSRLSHSSQSDVSSQENASKHKVNFIDMVVTLLLLQSNPLYHVALVPHLIVNIHLGRVSTCPRFKPDHAHTQPFNGPCPGQPG